MTERVKWRAIWGMLGVAATFALIVYLAGHFEAQLQKINWPLVSLLSVFVVGAVAVYRWNDQLARYNLIELVMNPVTGKPDPYRHLLFVFAGLTVWAIVQVVLAEEWSQLQNLLLGALGFFVAKPAIDGLSDAIGRRPVAADGSGGNLQINAPNADTVNVPRAAEAATEIDTPPRRPRPMSAIRTLP